MKTPLIGVIVVASWLAGCSLLPKTAPLPALHDFGPPAEVASATRNFDVLVNVRAVSWLDGTEIYYRLEYADATRVHAYADNDWLAPPAELLQARLQAELGNQTATGNASASVYRLTVHLLDFEQVFSSAQTATVRIRAVAELQDASDGVLVTRHLFDVSQSAQPDVEGAVQGASHATATLVAELVRWVQTGVMAGTRPASLNK